MPVRLAHDRVHYQDLARQPYTPPNPGLHHRNETLVGVADPLVALHIGREGTPWSVAGRVGVSVPLGATEPNPFELGRLGLWHQHIQFGTGTWDPIAGLAVGRSAGGFDVQLNGLARLIVAENEHGYRAGNRYNLLLLGARRLGAEWSADAGLNLAREEPEEWSGAIEDEGNLGRTDLFLSLGAGRTFSPIGTLALNLQIPLVSESTGDQVRIPVVLSLVVAR